MRLKNWPDTRAKRELAVAQAVLRKIEAPTTLTNSPTGNMPRELDPGYFLIAGGRPALEIELNYRPPLLTATKALLQPLSNP